jgi:hypothetical protein
VVDGGFSEEEVPRVETRLDEQPSEELDARGRVALPDERGMRREFLAEVAEFIELRRAQGEASADAARHGAGVKAVGEDDTF